MPAAEMGGLAQATHRSTLPWEVLHRGRQEGPLQAQQLVQDEAAGWRCGALSFLPPMS